jgi:hypothetical protein
MSLLAHIPSDVIRRIFIADAVRRQAEEIGEHPNHTVLARRLQDYLRWRNANARYPDVLAAQRRERARIRSQRQQRWVRPKTKAA